MQYFLQVFLIIPLVGFLLSLLIPRKKEPVISWIALGTVGLQLTSLILFIGFWIWNDHPVLDVKHFTVYKTTGFEIFVDFFFDKVAAAFAFIGALLTLLVTIFSRYYLHREEGFKRFFNTMLLFFLGYNIIIFSGNFETLFVGWELLGISSFLLIAFYRDRYLPVKNGMKVISVYRFSDISLLLAMWLSHHLWHQNITFLRLNDVQVVTQQIQEHYTLSIIIAVFILLAAAIKSAQLPFSSWLPRAMEGPTTSSAIFYGSLSVHIGVFLLLRTYPFWENLAPVKIAVIVIGLVTSIVATSIASVQSTVKTQIAYSSIVQIGLIFIEVALGFHTLALIHFTGNAFLRTYQLLVSPSVLSYLVHDQFYNFVPGQEAPKPSALDKWKNTVYMLSVKECNLDSFLHRYLWSPFKWIGNKLAFLTGKAGAMILAILFLAGIYYFLYRENTNVIYALLPAIFSLLGLLLVLKSFAERGDAITSWLLVFASQLFILLAVSLNQRFSTNELVIYLGGTVVSFVAGLVCLRKIKAIDSDIEMNGFHGYSYERPGIAFIFLLSSLGLLGFPITPTFIGIDILFTHIGERQFPLIVFTALSFLFIELSVLRIYARIFLGQHKKPYHPIAFRSS
jgi:NADH:ubiquinone oxidoreductase subunit 5 (subunit L)/multisubunit Na+/H+ antiporter MnhA subunit